MKPSHNYRPVFDDPNVVSAAGLVPAFRLAGSAGFYDLLDAVTVSDSSPGSAHPRRWAPICARSPTAMSSSSTRSTPGCWPDSLGGVPALVAGGDAEGIAFVDVDDTIREVHGYSKQAAAYGYTRQRGLNIQLATICTPLSAPVIAGARLRRGNVSSANGAGRLLARAINTARAAGVSGRVLARADAGYYKHHFVAAAIRAKAWFSVTAPMNPSVVTAICEIPEQAWQPISYPNAVFDEAEQRWISQAEVAEIDYTAFIGRRKGRRKSDHVGCRLVVRRVKRLQPLAGDGSTQGELFATYRHHAFITNSTLSTVEADQRHRDHAIIEQVIAELKNGPLAHLPSGQLRRQRRLGRARGDRVQPRPRQRRHQPRPPPMGDPPDPDHQHPRPDRDHRPPADPAPAPRLALGHALAGTMDRRNGATHTSHHLTTQPRTARPPEEPDNGRAGAGRQASHARTTATGCSPKNQRFENHCRWIRAEHRGDVPAADAPRRSHGCGSSPSSRPANSPAKPPTDGRWAIGASCDVLEVAIGTGLNLSHYPTDVSITGIDFSGPTLAIARQRADQLNRKVDLKEAHATCLNLPDATFDTVVCTSGLCAIPDDEAALAEMVRVLKPSGRLLLADRVAATGRIAHGVQRILPRAMPLVVERHERFGPAGIVERLAATKP